MADTKISALPDSAALDGTEVVPILQGGVNKRSPLSRVLTYILSGLGGAAAMNVGTGAGTVAAGNDSRFSAINTATQGALDAKATPAQITAAINALVNGAPGALDTLKEIADQLAADENAVGALVATVATKAPLASPAFTGTPTGITKAHVGLGNVDNTADTAKPVSTVQQTALDLKANVLDTINAQTGTTYTLQASDAGKVVELSNAAAITVTVPNSLPVGFNCLIAQTGAGLVTVAAGAGATLNAQAGLKSPGQWGEMSLRVRSNAGSAAVATLAGGVA